MIVQLICFGLAIGFAFAYALKLEELERIKKKLPANIKNIYLEANNE